jgi:hypothetical protein
MDKARAFIRNEASLYLPFCLFKTMSRDSENGAKQVIHSLADLKSVSLREK